MRNATKKMIWILVSLIAGVSISVVTGIVNPAEKVNALWIITATLSPTGSMLRSLLQKFCRWTQVCRHPLMI
jgi:hypothetical protein